MLRPMTVPSRTLSAANRVVVPCRYGVGRRIDIEPDHVAQLVNEVRIVREIELPITVRLKPVCLPDAPDRAGADAARPCHQIGGPMGGLDRRIGKRQRHHARGHFRTERRDARGPRLVVQEAVDAFLHEPFLPAPDAGLRLAGPAHDLVGANTVGAREDDRRPPSVFLRGVTVLVIASSRSRTDRVIVMEIPVRMRQPRTATETEESQSGLFCQAKTTLGAK